eukprot:2291928-Pyramimonas_sp.AAC.1
MGLVAMVMATVLGSALGSMARFIRTARAYISALVGALKGFAGGSKMGRDATLALDGDPTAALARHGPSEAKA